MESVASTSGLQPLRNIKVEHVESEIEEVEEIVEESVVMDDSNNNKISSVVTVNNVQYEVVDIKSLLEQEGQPKSGQVQDLEEENKNLKKELTVLSEKFQLIHIIHLNQAKLIEFFLRMDMIRSCENPDEKELEDLQRKIELCANVIEEYNVKYNEACSDKRRQVLSANHSQEPEKKAAVWDHYTIQVDPEGNRWALCNFCGKSFAFKSFTANKCRDHLYDQCDKAPENIKAISKARDLNGKSTFSVWNYFLNKCTNGKTVYACAFCGVEYSSRNATKSREHLAFKCKKIETDVRDKMRGTFSQEYIQQVNSARKSSIWEHFHVVNDESNRGTDKAMIQCIYCCMNYANKNATKCREHLLERCDKIPNSIRHRINFSFFEAPLKTWTQVKIPIWNHFSSVYNDGKKNFRCNYCHKLYTSKNVTKFRVHLLHKCTQISDTVKHALEIEVSTFYKEQHKNESIMGQIAAGSRGGPPPDDEDGDDEEHLDEMTESDNEGPVGGGEEEEEDEGEVYIPNKKARIMKVPLTKVEPDSGDSNEAVTVEEE